MDKAVRLSEFIRTHAEDILLEWEGFARTHIPAGEAMNVISLRDHAAAMLEMIALDLESPQTKREQRSKSEGAAISAPVAEDTAAQQHGADRALSGFTLSEMVSEYRALRASVIRLWTSKVGELGQSNIEELTRFNEAIDQALAESSLRYTENLNRSREMFIGILGHDLRSPLAAIITSASFLAEDGQLSGPTLELARRIANSGRRMNKLIGDLLDFTRSRLGRGIPIVRADLDLEAAAKDAVAEVVSSRPNAEIRLNASGPLSGEWDRNRISQVLSNLINNAVQHGAENGTVKVTLQGESREVLMSVHNQGPAIPETTIRQIFEPLKRNVPGGEDEEATAGLGLGLYITQQIVHAHGGTIAVESSKDKGTTFTVHLPR